mmetsp:Transcript_22363/g.67233  ORF Transcript_22363/g.67233 Transcript_22363/m.67233 type:complete len:262 (+) Transcript_22363:3473-4258(+)
MDCPEAVVLMSKVPPFFSETGREKLHVVTVSVETVALQKPVVGSFFSPVASPLSTSVYISIAGLPLVAGVQTTAVEDSIAGVLRGVNPAAIQRFAVDDSDMSIDLFVILYIHEKFQETSGGDPSESKCSVHQELQHSHAVSIWDSVHCVPPGCSVRTTDIAPPSTRPSSSRSQRNLNSMSLVPAGTHGVVHSAAADTLPAACSSVVFTSRTTSHSSGPPNTKSAAIRTPPKKWPCTAGGSIQKREPDGMPAANTATGRPGE